MVDPTEHVRRLAARLGLGGDRLYRGRFRGKNVLVRDTGGIKRYAGFFATRDAAARNPGEAEALLEAKIRADAAQTFVNGIEAPIEIEWESLSLAPEPSGLTPRGFTLFEED
mgnify:FL=1